MKKSLQNTMFTGIIIGGVVVVAFFIYGCYWAAKTVSYNVFYEDMVRDSIVEMVKPEALKK